MNSDKKHEVAEVGRAYPASDLASDSSRTALEIDREAIGKRLEQIRGNETQKDWAAHLGLPLKTYQNYERGLREPDARTYSALALAGWNLNWVVTGVGPRRIEALKPGTLAGPGMQPDMMQKAVESAIGVFQRFNKMPSASQLARASVLLYLMFTDTEPDPTEPVDQLLAKIIGEQVEI